MDTTKNIERGARLGEFLDRKMLNKKEFSTFSASLKRAITNLKWPPPQNHVGMIGPISITKNC